MATAAPTEVDRPKERTDKAVRRQAEAHAKQGSREATGQEKRQRKSERKDAAEQDAHTADAETAELRRAGFNPGRAANG